MKHRDVQRHTFRRLVPLVMAGIVINPMSAAFGQNTRPYRERGARASQRDDSPNYGRTSLPSGTVIPVRLDDALSSKSAARGDRFTATVIPGADNAGLPDGTRLEGVVRESVPSDGGEAGSLDVEFRRISFPGGSSQAINASIYSLSGKTLKRGDGRLIATGDKSKDRLKFIGIGAGAGLLLGTVTKQNSLLSVLLGAGAGYLYSEVGNKPKPGDVNLKEGQEFGVRLDRELAFDAQTRRYYRQNRRTPAVDSSQPAGYSEYTDQIRVRVDDRRVRFQRESRPYIRDGVVFLPLAVMGEACSFDYRYDANARTIYARNDEVHTALGSRTAMVNGGRRSLPVAAEQRNGVTFVPLQFIAWAADGEVGYDEASGIVTVFSGSRR